MTTWCLKTRQQPCSIGEILKSGILKRNSARYFWYSRNDLIDIIANAPAKSMLLLVQLLRLHSIITLVEKVFLAALRLVSRSAQQLF
jgi:hypothetical protein